MKTKLRSSFLKSLTSLRVLVFVVIFAAAGVTYLLASHAQTPMTVSVSSSCWDSGYEYCKPGWDLTLSYQSPCGSYVSGQILTTEEGAHRYIIEQDSNGNPYLYIDGATQNSPLPGFTICSPTGSLSLAWQGVIYVASQAPTVSFTSGSTTTTAGSITVSGTAGDHEDGIASVTVNGTPATISGGGPEYTFTATVPLAMGANQLTAVASDHVGNTASTGPLSATRNAPLQTGGSSGGSSGSSSSGGSSGKSSGSSGSTSHSSSGSSGSSSSSGQPAASSSGNPSSSDTGDSTDLGDTADTSTAVASDSTANVPAGQTSQITSSDGLVTVTFPSGTFDTDAYCTVDLGNTNDVPPKTTNPIGPYSIDCTDSNGDSLSLGKAVTVSVKLSSNKTYAAYQNTTNWTELTGTTSKQTISFKLTKNQEFAVAQPKGSSLSSILLNVGGAILILLLIVIIIAWLRRRGSGGDEPPATTVDSGNW